MHRRLWSALGFHSTLAALAMELLRRRFGLAAFLIPFGLRSVPELLAGPFPVGFDTIAFYVPVTIDWAAGKAGWQTVLGTAPLLYLISVPLYLITKVSPVWTFKALGPILYGCLSWSLFRFLRQTTHVSQKAALGGTLFTSAYFVTLRIGWDLYRNMMGLTFILLTLPLIGNVRHPRNMFLVASLTLLAVLSDQFTAILGLSLLAIRAAVEFKNRRRESCSRILAAALPSALLFAVMGTIDIELGLVFIHDQLPLPQGAEFLLGAGFIAYAYLPLVPLALVGYRRIRNLELKSWMFTCILGSATVLIPVLGLIESYRWTLLMDFPLCIYAGVGIPSVVKFLAHGRFLERMSRIMVPTLIVILALSSGLYLALPAQRASSYYAMFPSLMPSSMLQSSIPASDNSNMLSMLDLVSKTPNSKTVLIVHQAVYGWVVAYEPQLSNRVINYGYGSPMEGVRRGIAANASTILLIWWSNGSGWHNQPSVPEGFISLFRSGELTVYQYFPNTDALTEGHSFN